jgi:hypothetical protein
MDYSYFAEISQILALKLLAFLEKSLRVLGVFVVNFILIGLAAITKNQSPKTRNWY